VSCVAPDVALALVPAMLPDERGAALGVAVLRKLQPNEAFVAWVGQAAPRLLPAVRAATWRVLRWIEGPPPPPPPPTTCALMGLHDCPSRSHWTRGCAIECPGGDVAEAQVDAAVEPLPPLAEWQALTGCLSLLLALLLAASAFVLLRSLPRCVRSRALSLPHHPTHLIAAQCCTVLINDPVLCFALSLRVTCGAGSL
jgi:hypothetical protein